MKAGSTSCACNSATNAAVLYATVNRNSRILAKSCNQMLLRRRLRSLSMLPNDPSPSVYLPQTAIARPTRTQAQKCCVRVGSSRAVSGNRSLWKSSDEIQYFVLRRRVNFLLGNRNREDAQHLCDGWTASPGVASSAPSSEARACLADEDHAPRRDRQWRSWSPGQGSSSELQACQASGVEQLF